MLMQNSPATASSQIIGQPISRVDGRAKVTGKATYAAEGPVEGCVHAVIIQSTIANGEISDLDTAAAEKAPGVLTILSHKNSPSIRKGNPKMHAETQLPLSEPKINYAGQHIACIVADTLARALFAAKLVKVSYNAKKAGFNWTDDGVKTEQPTKSMGELLQFTKEKPDEALARTDVTKIEATYITPVENHNPMEMSATIAHWDDDDHLTVWDATQAVANRKQSLANTFGLDPQNVRVLCPFVGGGFGCKGDQWPHAVIAAMAAQVVKKPVKLMLTRAQMFTSCGHRPVTTQKMSLAATPDGKLVALRHDITTEDSIVGHHVETCAIGTSAMMYATPSLAFTHTLKRINGPSATFMRAPGECPGTFAVEGAMDELAYALKIDPLELRRTNYSNEGIVNVLPFSTKYLNACYDIGAEKFGWSKRNPVPRSMKGPKGELVGWGMATATYPARRFPNAARIRLSIDSDGKLKAFGASATQDLGTGSYTIFTQMVSELTGLPMEQCKFDLGDSNFPPGAVSGGSQTAAGIGQALSDAADNLKDGMIELMGDSPLKGVKFSDVHLMGGRLEAINDSSKFIMVADVLKKTGKAYLEGQTQKAEGSDELEAKRKKYNFQSFGVHFVEVTIDQPVPLVRVNRVVSVMDVGRIINHKTARSQVLGGVVMGIGMALMEETVYDPKTFRPVNDNLADYPVPVNPDVHEIDVHLIDKPDPLFNAMGCRGIGEIGITGIAAAIANAVFHATGKRVRELPITPDKILDVC